MIEVLGGLGWLVLAGACCAIFGALIWAALFDPNTRAQIVKASGENPEHSSSRTFLIWAIMAALYAGFLYFAWMGSSLMIEGFV